MKEILESIYVDSLIASLSFGCDYAEIKRFNGVKDKLFQLDTIKKLLVATEKIYKEEKIPIIDSEQRNNILSVLSDIRFDYQFQNEQNREEIIDKINDCIILLKFVGVNLSIISPNPNILLFELISNLFNFTYKLLS